MKELIAELLAKHVGMKKEEILDMIEIPRKEFGDYAFPCFKIAKKLRKAPEELAEEIAKKLKLPKEIEKISVVKGYINFFLNKQFFVLQVLKKIFEKKKEKRKKEKIMIEFVSPNLNKPLHLGHLKNEAIGSAISNILEFCSYDVVRANLYNDRGIHMCKPIIALRLFKEKKMSGEKPDHYVGRLYVAFEKKAKEQPELLKKNAEMLKKWEKKDIAILKEWKKLREMALKGIEATLRKIGTKFDVTFYESDFYDKAGKIIKAGLEKKIFFKDKKNNIVAALSPLQNKVVLRGDGTSVYITNDLALTPYKFSRFGLDRHIWVAGSEQTLYFKQLFKIFELLGYKWAKNCEHLSYGMVLLKKGKMKSREGNVVDADNFIDEIIKLVKKELRKRYKLGKREEEKRARAIALAAIRYWFLKIDPTKDILFVPEKAISFDGETGPYLQYAYARACSILKKAKKKIKIKKIKIGKIEDVEFELVKKLSLFPSVVLIASKQLKPNLLASYAYELSKIFTEFYHSCPVLKAKERQERLVLVEATSVILKNCLQLLNIKALEKM